MTVLLWLSCSLRLCKRHCDYLLTNESGVSFLLHSPVAFEKMIYPANLIEPPDSCQGWQSAHCFAGVPEGDFDEWGS